MPFRVAQPTDDDAVVATRPAPPRVIAFAVTERLYRVVLADRLGVTMVAIDRREGAIGERRRLDGASHAAVAVALREHWGAFDAALTGLHAWSGAGDEPRTKLGVLQGRIAALFIENDPCVAFGSATHATGGSGPEIHVLGFDLGEARVNGWHAPVSSRTLLAATCTVFGPAAVFSTDHDDEIDVCVNGVGGEALTRTVSLGRGEQFEAAVGGGRRILVVSRSEGRIVPRTLASDIRSELNPAPIRARTGWDVGRVRVAYANGPFVIAHEEHRDDHHAAVLTVFDAGVATTTRLLLPSVDGVAVEGKDLAVAAVTSGASAPILWIQRTTRDGGRDRRYAYLLEHAPVDTSSQRHAVLADVAEMVAASLGADAAEAVGFESFDPRRDVTRFKVPGPDAGHDLTFAMLLDADGAGIVAIRVGEGRAPDARGLHFTERVREWITGDDDGDARTTRVELPKLVLGVGAIVSAVGALRASA